MTEQQEAALRLAQDLRGLADKFSEGWHDGIKIDSSDIMLLAMAASALEQPSYRAVKTWHDGKPVYVTEQPAMMQPVEPGTGASGEVYVVVQPNHTEQHLEMVAQPAQQEPNIPGLAADPSAFVRWAEKNGYDMTAHPLHFLFLNEKTAAARAGWKAAHEHYIRPQAREWVGLTDEELLDCLGPEAVRIPPGWRTLTSAIEAKLREKNA